MRKIYLLFSAGDPISGAISGIGGLIMGAAQMEKSKSEQADAKNLFNSAIDNVAPNNDPELTTQQATVRRVMGGLQNGLGSGYSTAALNGGVRSGADAVSRLAGGNTGTALATIDELHNNLSDMYGKEEASNQQQINGLLGLDTNLSGTIAAGNTASDDKRAQFYKMRADQVNSQGLSDQKSGASNIMGGISSLGSVAGDMVGGM